MCCTFANQYRGTNGNGTGFIGKLKNGSGSTVLVTCYHVMSENLSDDNSEKLAEAEKIDNLGTMKEVIEENAMKFKILVKGVGNDISIELRDILIQNSSKLSPRNKVCNYVCQKWYIYPIFKLTGIELYGN